MGTVAEEQYHLRWNDYHSSLTQCFRDLRDNDEMLDVTIMSDGRTFRAHKLVLSACSPMFKAMLKKASNKGLPFLQPIVFLHGVRHEDIEAILDFMYHGEVSVSQEDLQSFLTVAEDLRVRGLTKMDLDNKKADEDLRPSSEQRPHNHFETESSRKRRRRLTEEDYEDELEVKRPGFADDEGQLHHSARDFSIDHGSANSSPFDQAYPGMTPPSLVRRTSNSMEPHGNVSFHRLGGRDHDDPLSKVMVTRSDKGWHCPECIHIATTKGNLKSHILSGRHKIGEKSFKCRFCDRSYSTRQSMQVHISTNHRHERDLELKQEITIQGDPIVMEAFHHHHNNSNNSSSNFSSPPHQMNLQSSFDPGHSQSYTSPTTQQQPHQSSYQSQDFQSANYGGEPDDDPPPPSKKMEFGSP